MGHVRRDGNSKKKFKRKARDKRCNKRTPLMDSLVNCIQVRPESLNLRMYQWKLPKLKNKEKNGLEKQNRI